MSFYLMAPFNIPEVVIRLPNPNFGDTQNPVTSMNLKRSMNGTVRTYIKTNQDYSFEYDFEMSREKILELQDFIWHYYKDKIRFVNHFSETYSGFITNEPIEFQTQTTGERGTMRLSLRGRPYG